MWNFPCSIASIILIVFVLSFSSVAIANKKKAQKHFIAGISLIDTQNYEDAAEEFEKSLKLYPTKNGFINLANCYIELERFNLAGDTLKRMRMKYQNLDEDWEDSVTEVEERWKSLVIPLEILVAEDGLIVNVDGEDVGTSPLSKPLFMASGTHKISIFKDKRKISDQKIVLKKGQGHTLLQIATPEGHTEQNDAPLLQQNTTNPVQFETTNGSTPPERRKRPWTITSYSIGALTGITAIITGSLALSRVSTLDETCENKICSKENQVFIDDTKKIGVFTNVMIGVSAFSVTLGTILLFVEGKKNKQESASTTKLKPLVGINQLGVSVTF